MLLISFFEDVYLPRRLRGKSENSVRLYRLCIRQFSRTLGKKAELSDLTEDNILKHLARRSEVAPATRNKELAELTAMWRLAVQRNLHEGWPNIQPETEPQRAPIAWMGGELSKLLSYARRQRGKIGDVPAGKWWHAFLRVMLDTGERVSAVRQVKVDWLQGEWLQFPAESRKGKTRDRSYKLSQEALAAVRELVKCVGSKGELFPWPYSPTYLWMKYRQLLKEAGLPATRKHGFHAIRKTHASILFAANVDPQESLDHSDRRTTQRYIDARYTREQQPSDILANFLANPGRMNTDPPNQATG